MRPVPPEAVALVKRFEGLWLKPYQDVAGVWTIGWGHEIRQGEDFGDGISEARAEEVLAADLLQAAGGVCRVVLAEVVPDLTEGQYAALIDFVFNEGEGHFASSTMAKLINSRCFARAGGEFDRWDMADGRQIPGLLRRREAELALWQGPASTGIASTGSSTTA